MNDAFKRQASMALSVEDVDDRTPAVLIEACSKEIFPDDWIRMRITPAAQARIFNGLCIRAKANGPTHLWLAV